jgi:hypothetical protein
METDDKTTTRPPSDLSRRDMLDMLKGASAGAAAVGLSAANPTQAEAQTGPAMPVSPYGGGPSTGLQFPPY